MKCPDKNSYDYKRLVNLLSGNEGAAYRIWRYYEDIAPEEGTLRALEAFDTTKNTISSKKAILDPHIKKVTLDAETHTYKHADNPDMEIESMSRKLDSFPETRYRGATAKEGYADSGTNVHEILEMVVKGISEESILKRMTESGVPVNVLNSFKDFKKKLESRGTILSEVTLFADNLPEKKAIGGTSDIVLLTNDGKIEIYDLKTTHITGAVRKAGESPWNMDKGHGVFKANRYTTQTMGYGRMIEWALRQPVSEYFLIPAIVENNIDDDPTSGYKSIEIKAAENIKDYGRMELAQDILDRIFGEKSNPPASDRIQGLDESSDLYTKLTGDISGTRRSPEQIARTVKRGTRKGVSGYYYGTTDEFIPFRNIGDPVAQQQQIIDEFVNKTVMMNNDLSYSVKNYLATRDKRYLSSLGDSNVRLQKVLDEFAGRTDIQVMNLKEIGGFEDKTNWLFIKEGDNTHLFYIGAESLNSRFATTGFANQNLFGKHITSTDAKVTLGSSLENTLGDARKLEATMIAVKLKESNPSMRFGITAVFGLRSGSPYSDIVDLKENLTTLAAIQNHPTLRDTLLSTSMLETLSKPGILDYKEYRTDFRQALVHYMSTRYPSGRDGDLLNLLTNTSQDALMRKEMLEKVKKMLLKKQDMGKDAATDYETYLLSAFFFQMQEIDISLLPISVFSNMASLPQNLRNPMLQKLNLQLNNAANEMSRRFRSEYKTEYNESVNTFLKSKNVGDKFMDYTAGDTPRHYVKLMKTITRDIITEDGKKSVTVPIMEFYDEDGSEFKALESSEQAFIRKTNDVIEKFATKSGIKWQRGRLPLIRSTAANRMFNSIRTGGPKAFTELVNNWLVDVESDFGTGQESATFTENIFRSQANDAAMDKRLELMGIENDGHIRMEQYQRWSTNVEAMVDMFVIQSLRHDTFNDIGASLRAANSIFQWHKSNLIGDRINTNIDFINWFHEYNINTKDVDSGTVPNKLMRALQKVTSMSLIAAKPTTALVSAIGNEMTIFSESIANYLTGSGYYTPATMTKAKFIIGQALGSKSYNQETYDKISLLMRKFRLFNEDISSLLNGYHREGDKFLFKSKNLFSLMNAADWQSRSSLMIAQMLEEGSWEAYSVVNDELQYDESKDKRFNGSGKYSKDQAQALRTVLAEAQELVPGSKLTSGHDDNMGNSMRAMANYLLGGFDRETRSGMNARWWGKMFISMKNWLPAKIDRWRLGNYKSEMVGDYTFETGLDGKMVPVWRGEQLEGILMSWLSAIHYVRKGVDPRKGLTKIQKNNIVRSMSDIIIASLAYLFYVEFPDDDDDTKADDYAAKVVRRGVDDLLVAYNLLIVDDFVWTPVPLEWVNTVYMQMFKAIAQADPTEVAKLLPGGRMIQDFNTMIDTENE